MKKNRFWLAGVFLALVSFAGVAQAAPVQKVPTTIGSGEDYQTHVPANRFTLGVSGGFGLVDTSGGFALIGNAATRIAKDGFIPDIVNPVFLEVGVGPLFTSGTTVWMYSLHMRWDFVKDSNWTWFAIGGFGGNITNEKHGDRVAFHPRFGVGAFYETEILTYRADFSHELITLGVSYPF